MKISVRRHTRKLKSGRVIPVRRYDRRLNRVSRNKVGRPKKKRVLLQTQAPGGEVINNPTITPILEYSGKKKILYNKKRSEGGGSVIAFQDEDELMTYRIIIPYSSNITELQINELDPDQPGPTVVTMKNRSGKQDSIIIEEAYKSEIQENVGEVLNRFKKNIRMKAIILRSRDHRSLPDDITRDNLRALAEDLNLSNPRGDTGPLFKRIKTKLLQQQRQEEERSRVPDIPAVIETIPTPSSSESVPAIPQWVADRFSRSDLLSFSTSKDFNSIVQKINTMDSPEEKRRAIRLIRLQIKQVRRKMKK